MGIIRKTMSVGTLGVVNYRSGGEKVAREAKKTRKAVSAESAAAAQAHAAEAAAWQAQADAARHQRQLAEARWAEEQSRLDAKPDWYSDPSALQACHHCGAPRGGADRDGSCQFCKAPQRQRYFDGSAWTDHVR